MGKLWSNEKLLYVDARVNGKYISVKRDTDIQGTSTTFKMPLGFTMAYAYIMSYDVNDKSIGYSMIYLYPENSSMN